MNFSLIVKSLAENDLRDAVEWYSKISLNLVNEFINELDLGFNSLKENPEIFQKRYGDMRVLFIDKFPYGIYFTIEFSTIYVHAVLHTKRNPEIGIARI